MMFRIILALSLATFATAQDQALIDLFLEATPLHPRIRTPDVLIPRPTSSNERVTTNEFFASPFKPLSECSGNKTDLKLGDFGSLTSPNYPRNYPGRMSCEWQIEGPPGTRIQAVLFDVVTQPWFFAYFDYVMIARNGNFSNVDRLSGDMNSKTPYVIESEANKLGIRFRSSALFNFRGFKLQYLVVPGAEPVPDFEKPVFDGVCGYPVLHPEATTQGPASATTEAGATSGSTEASSAAISDGQTSGSTEAIGDAVTIGSVDVSATDIPIIQNGTKAGRAVNEPGLHIIGGIEARKNSHPWMVALLIDNRHFCGGSIIDEQHVLTAAHCTDRASQITMLLGSHNIKAGKDVEDGRRVVNITKENIFQHPEYNGNTITYDISILRLPQKLVFTDKIKPICLPNRYHLGRFYNGEPTLVSGWGKPADNAAGVSPFLKEADVKVMPNSQCRVAFRGIVTGNLICIETTPKSSPCKGDSGGPLMIEQLGPLGPYYMQLGIVSFGSLTCERGLPVGFTRVTAFLDYINEITGKNY